MDKARWFYPDTSYIYGGFKSKAIDFKIRAKPQKKYAASVKDETNILIQKGVKFVISELTEYEIKRALMNEEGLNFVQSNKIFQDRIKECPIYAKLQCFTEIKISNDFLNWALENRLSLADALHIMVASRLSLFVITKEKKGKFERWSKAYDSVLSSIRFQEMIKKMSTI